MNTYTHICIYIYIFSRIQICLHHPDWQLPKRAPGSTARLQEAAVLVEVGVPTHMALEDPPKAGLIPSQARQALNRFYSLTKPYI